MDILCTKLVATKQMSGIHICVYLQCLNRSRKHGRFVISTFPDILAKMMDYKVFSKLDAKNSYHQLQMEESSLPMTFIIGHFWFRHLPFGITGIRQIFQRHIGELLDGRNGMAVMQDDITISSVDIEEHVQWLNKVLTILKDARLELNMSKCLLIVL